MVRPILPDAYQLFHQGAIALADVEAAGIRIDTRYLKRAKIETAEKIKTIESELREDEVYKAWEDRFRGNVKLGNREQLGTVVFDVLGYKRRQVVRLESEDSNQRSEFDHINLPFLKSYFRYERLKKVLSTYLKNIEVETVDGRIHPFFNLNRVISYRSSSDKINFQNQPTRDDEQAEIVRKCFVSDDENSQLLEKDFKGIEVCGAACYTHDQVLIDYILDASKDMHRDMAAQCYMIDLKTAPKEYWKEGSGKKARYGGKNMFVFPQFYGDKYVACAAALWEAIDMYELMTPDGTPLREHLRRQGITELGLCSYDHEPKRGTFEHHIKEVQEDFWGRRFKGYDRWKRTWWALYLEQGYVDSLTGFRYEGIFTRKEIWNYPIQGSAFHCLLWCLIELQQRMRKAKMRSRIVGQIHDSMLSNVYRDERDDLLGMVEEVLTKALREHWDWIIVPMSIEIEECPYGGSWFEKKPIKV